MLEGLQPLHIDKDRLVFSMSSRVEIGFCLRVSVCDLAPFFLSLRGCVSLVDADRVT